MARSLLRSEDGFSNIVFSIFLMVALLIAFQAVTLYEQVQTERTQLTQALTLALEAATTGGSSTSSTGGQITWNAPIAFDQAVTAIEAFLPVTLASDGQGQNGQYAEFTPTGTYPPGWSGNVLLADFQTSQHAGTAYLFLGQQSEPGPFVAADLSVPVTVRFLGLPLNFDLQVGRVSLIDAYDGSQFVMPQ